MFRLKMALIALFVVAVVGVSAWAGQDADRAGALGRALALSADDRVLLGRGVAAVHDFARHERAGQMERSGFVLLKIKDRAAFGVEIGGRMGALDRDVEVGRRVETARARVMPSLRMSPIPEMELHSVTVAAGWTEEAFADFLMATGDYEFVEPDWIVRPMLTPNDPFYSNQYHHQTAHLNTHWGWNFVTGDSSMIVAIVDTGVDIDHPDLANRVSGYNSRTRMTEAEGGDVSDVQGHGSKVAGFAVATGNNGIGVSGMGWGFALMPIKGSDDNGNASMGDLTHGARWAVNNGAKVVNCSFSGVSASTVGITGTYVRDNGGLLVWAAGNDGSSTVTQDHVDVTIVGATTQTGARWSSSSYGNGLDIMAPGVGVWSTNKSGGYGNAGNGTSFASPLIAGGMALIWSGNPALSGDQVEQLLFDHAKDMNTAGWDTLTGWGLADIGAAVEAGVSGDVHFDVPFTEDFDAGGGTLSTVLWPDNTGAVVTDEAVDEPSGDYSLKLDAMDAVTSNLINAAGHAVGDLTLRIGVQGAPGAGSLEVAYLDAGDVWHTLMTVGEDLAVGGVWRFVERTLPAGALHGDMKLRLSFDDAGGGGHVFVDELRIDAFEGIKTFWLETFEQGVEDAHWAVFDGVIGSGAAGAPSGAMSVRLEQGEMLETASVRTNSTLSGQVATGHASYWVRPESLEAGDTISLEWFDVFAQGWAALDTVDAADVSDTRFHLRQVEIPWPALTLADTEFRVTTQLDDGDDAWHVDNFYIGGEQFAECPADLNGDGFVNLADVTAFITAFTTGDPLADMNGDGFLNLADVTAFIDAFVAGC